MHNFKSRFLSAIAAMPLVFLSATSNAQMFSGDWAKELQHDQPAPKTAEQQSIEKDILGLQAAVRAATVAKDAAQLANYFTPDYTMTHGGGEVQDAPVRIAFISKGTGGFEAMTPVEQTIRVLGKDGAFSIANNSLQMNGQTVWIRYLIVYSRGAKNEGYKGWREAAAHVIAIFPPKPPATEK